MLEGCCKMPIIRNAEGWTDFTPSGNASGTAATDTLIAYVSSSDGDDGNDGRDPLGVSLSGATYTHSSRTVTSAGAFSGFTLSSDPYVNKLWITAATGGVTANRLYEIESKTSNDAVVLAANSGLTADASGVGSGSGPKATASAGYAMLRHGSPDFLLFKRGDTWTSSISTDWERSGYSIDEPMVVGTYGDISADRPVFRVGVSGCIVCTGGTASYSHVAIIGIDAYAHTRDPDFGTPSPTGDVALFWWDRPGQNILFEDCRGRFGKTSIGGDVRDATQLLNLTIRRCQFVDSYQDTSGNAHGCYFWGIDGLTIEECLFDHNGWYGDRDTGGAAGATGQATQFNHNIYLSHGLPTSPSTRDNRAFVIIRGNILARPSSHCCQLRSGGTFEDNLCLEAPIPLSTGVSQSQYQGTWPEGCDSDVRNNVFMYADFIETSNPKGYTSYSNARILRLQGNVIANIGSVQHTTNRAMELMNATDATELVMETVEVSDNIVYQWSWNSGANAKHDLWIRTVPTSLTVEDNLWYAALNPTSGTNRNIVDEGIVFIDVAATPEAYTDWRESTSGSTMEDFYAIVRSQRRGNWDVNYMAAAINTWIRSGFTESDAPPDNAGLRLRSPQCVAWL